MDIINVENEGVLKIEDPTIITSEGFELINHILGEIKSNTLDETLSWRNDYWDKSIWTKSL